MMGEMREIIRSNLEQRIAESGYTQKEIAEKLGVSKSSITNWIKGKNSPDVELVVPICKLLNISVKEFYGEIDETRDTKNFPRTAEATPGEFSDREQAHIQKYRLLDDYGKEAVDGVLDVESRRCEAEKQEAERRARAAVKEQKRLIEVAEEIAPEGDKIIELPFDELKASAGTGYELDYDRLIPWKVIYNEMTRKADFCLEVDGRSMEPMIHDGDIILVRQQPSVDIGEIGLFTVGDKGFVKKQGEDRLISINDAFEDIFPGEYDVFFCRGKVIGVLDPAWIVEK